MQVEENIKYCAVSEPCRNFNILGAVVINDPLDRKEKVVLSNFAAGSIGNLVFVDPETGEGEYLKLPGDSGAWAIMNLDNDKLLVGTCPEYGYIHCLNLKDRTWMEPLRDENERYIWNFTLGSDGMVYCGTYPGCVLLQYDPELHKLRNMGRMSSNPDNMYSRNVSGALPGYILVGGGFESPFFNAWNIENHSIRTIMLPNSKIMPSITEVKDNCICITTGREINLYDTKTFEWIKSMPLEKSMEPKNGLKLKNGEFFVLRGQDYFIRENEEDIPLLKRIPTPPPATHIHSLISDQFGVIWGSCGFGQTIFSYNPKSGYYWNSSSVCNCGGEVYGMIYAEGKLFMTAYAGGDHIIYDPEKPWNQLENENPRTIKTMAPTFVRPLGRSALGPDGGIWTGWSTNYGTYGGGLSRIDTVTLEVQYWYDIIPGQQVISVCADDKYVYFTTDSGGNGLPDRGEACHFCVFSVEGKLVFDYQFDKGIHAGVVHSAGGKVLVTAENDLRLFDPSKMEFTKALNVGKRCGCMIYIGNDNILAFCKEDIEIINMKYESVDYVSSSPRKVNAAAITPQGEIFFSSGTQLYRLPYEAEKK